MNYCFPLFLFDWQVITAHVSCGYGDYAQRELKKGLSRSAPIVMDPNWRGFHGDLFARHGLSKLFGIPELSADASLVREEAVHQLKSGPISTMYVIGIGNSKADVVRQTDAFLKHHGIVGYLGVFLLTALHQSDAEQIRRGMVLPLLDWSSIK
jgi:hypothetical protein